MSNFNALRLRSERRKTPFPLAEVVREDADGNPVKDDTGNTIKDTIYLRRPKSGEFLRIMEIEKQMAELDETADDAAATPAILEMMTVLSELCVIRDDGADAGRIRIPGAPPGFEPFEIDDPLDLMIDYDLDISKIPEAMEHWGFKEPAEAPPKGKAKPRKG